MEATGEEAQSASFPQWPANFSRRSCYLSWNCLPCPRGTPLAKTWVIFIPASRRPWVRPEAGEVGMKFRSLWVTAAVCAVVMAGCAELGGTSSGTNKLLTGHLLETTTTSGHVLRLMAQELEGWDCYDRNPRKGDGDACILKAEARF